MILEKEELSKFKAKLYITIFSSVDTFEESYLIRSTGNSDYVVNKENEACYFPNDSHKFGYVSEDLFNYINNINPEQDSNKLKDMLSLSFSKIDPFNSCAFEQSVNRLLQNL